MSTCGYKAKEDRQIKGALNIKAASLSQIGKLRCFFVFMFQLKLPNGIHHRRSWKIGDQLLPFRKCAVYCMLFNVYCTLKYLNNLGAIGCAGENHRSERIRSGNGREERKRRKKMN